MGELGLSELRDGMTRIRPHVVGQQRAREMIVFGTTCTADALEMRLAWKVVALEAEATAQAFMDPATAAKVANFRAGKPS